MKQLIITFLLILAISIKIDAQVTQPIVLSCPDDGKFQYAGEELIEFELDFLNSNKCATEFLVSAFQAPNPPNIYNYFGDHGVCQQINGKLYNTVQINNKFIT